MYTDDKHGLESSDSMHRKFEVIRFNYNAQRQGARVCGKSRKSRKSRKSWKSWKYVVREAFHLLWKILGHQLRTKPLACLYRTSVTCMWKVPVGGCVTTRPRYQAHDNLQFSPKNEDVQDNSWIYNILIFSCPGRIFECACIRQHSPKLVWAPTAFVMVFFKNRKREVHILPKVNTLNFFSHHFKAFFWLFKQDIHRKYADSFLPDV